MRGVKKVEVDNEEVYLKKSFDGWRVIHPFKNDDGSINWFNISTGGSYWNLIKVLIIVLFIMVLSWSYFRDIKVCTDFSERIQEDPVGFCLNITSKTTTNKPLIEPIDLSKIVVIKEVENGSVG